MTVDQVAAITPHLPDGIERIGVFDSHDEQEIAHAAAEAGLTGVQLHGGLDMELLQRLDVRLAGKVRIIQTVHWTIQPDAHDTTPDGNVLHLEQEFGRIRQLGVADRVLVDSKIGSAGGGTGVPFDWTRAQSAFRGVGTQLSLILAGGLRPQNVRQAIAELAPFGVDVCSGVERSVGRKDSESLALFLENARQAPQKELNPDY
jgi:phosphoribosylanthranilate isomerase